MSRSQRLAAAATLMMLSLACGDAVTNPDLEGFDSDPRVIAGTWATLLNDARGGTTRYNAELTPGGGTFFGIFRFFRFGNDFELAFNDGIWNGTRLTFSAIITLGGETSRTFWEATYRPATDSEPARLLLVSDIVGVPVEYVRPADLPAGAR